MRMVYSAIGAAMFAMAFTAAAQAQTAPAASTCPAGYGWVGPHYDKDNLLPASCVPYAKVTANYAATATAADPQAQPCPAGSGWVGPHYEKDNWVIGRCVTYSHP